MSLLRPRYRIAAAGESGRWQRISFEDAITIANAEAESRRRAIYVWRREGRRHRLVYTSPDPEERTP